MRGNLVALNHETRILGSIPACAGEPIPIMMNSKGIRVYPRVCGGTCGVVSRGITYQGLSPRVRGNRCDNEIAVSSGRSIPACAGEP